MIDTTELTVPVGEAVLGRVLNGRGEPIDGGPPLTDAPRVPINQEQPVMIDCDAAPQMLHTGIKLWICSRRSCVVALRK